MKLAHEVAREIGRNQLDAARGRLTGMGRRERVAWLRTQWRERLGDIEPGAPPEVRTVWTKPLEGGIAEGLTLEHDDGIIIPIVLLRPQSAASRPPVVVAVSQGGKERLSADNHADVQELLRRGIAVCMPDVRGVGETSPDTRRGPSSAEITLATTELMMGSSLLGARLKDVRTVLAYLATRPDLDGQRIAMWGDSHAPENPKRLILDETPGWQMGPQIQYQAEPLGGLLALFAALYEERLVAVAVRRGLTHFASILDDRFAYVPGDVILPRTLDAGDLPDVAAAIAPRPILLQAMRDCRNRAIPAHEVRKRYAGASVDDKSLVEWLAGTLTAK